MDPRGKKPQPTWKLIRSGGRQGVLHFAKLNVPCWFDGSELVAIEHWGFRRPQWCMRLMPRTGSHIAGPMRKPKRRLWSTSALRRAGGRGLRAKQLTGGNRSFAPLLSDRRDTALSLGDEG